MKRLPTIIVGAVVLVALSGTAFYLGRSSRVSLDVRGGVRGMQGREGFGKVPVPGAPRIRNLSGARSPARSLDPSTSLLPITFGRSSPWRPVDGDVKFVWGAGSPKLPDSMKVYRPSSAGKDRAYSLAKALGIDGPPTSISILRPETPDADYIYRFEVLPSENSPPSSLDLSNEGFLFVRGRSVKAPAGGNSRETVDEKRAIDAARSWLKEKGLMPAGRVEAKVVTSAKVPYPVGPAARGALTVELTAKLDGLDIYLENRGGSPAPFAAVEVDHRGEVISARGQLLSDLASAEYPLRPVGEVFKELGASWPARLILPESAEKGSAASAIPGSVAPRAGTRGAAQTMTAKSVEIAYVLVADPNRGAFYEPVYVFTGSLDGSKGRIEGVKVIAPALKAESLDWGEGRPGSNGKLPGGPSGVPSIGLPGGSGAKPSRPLPPDAKR